VSCDKPYWFRVSMVLNDYRSLTSESEFTVVCQDKSLYLEIGGEDVSTFEKN
jgi:hypothetical protein